MSTKDKNKLQELIGLYERNYSERLKEIKEYAAKLPSVPKVKQIEELLKKSPSQLADLGTKYDWLQIWDVCNCLADAFTYAKENNLLNEQEKIDSLLCMLYLYLGRYDLPNEPISVNLLSDQWQTTAVKKCNLALSYTLQVYKENSEFARIIKSVGDNHILIARGSTGAMTEKLSRLGEKYFFKPGDIVVIDRDRLEIERLSKYIKDKTGFELNMGISLPLYAHFGICAGPDEIIHFSGKSDMLGTKTIHSSTVKEFLDCVNTKQSIKDIYIVHVPEAGMRPYKLFPDSSKIKFNMSHVELWDCIDYKKIGCYDAATTIKRAREKQAFSATGHDKEYSIISYNCEDFAFYCKTGMYLSQQIENVEKLSKMLFSLFSKQSWLPVILAYDVIKDIMKRRNKQ